MGCTQLLCHILDSYRSDAAALTGRNLPCAGMLHAGKQHGYLLVQDQHPSVDYPLAEEELKLQLDIKVDKGSEPTPDLPFLVSSKYVARCHMNKADYDTSTDGPRCSRHTQHSMLM